MSPYGVTKPQRMCLFIDWLDKTMILFIRYNHANTSSLLSCWQSKDRSHAFYIPLEYLIRSSQPSRKKRLAIQKWHWVNLIASWRYGLDICRHSAHNVDVFYCPACRTTLVATRFRVAVICPIIQVPHCIKVFLYFVWFVFINHIFQFYYELCTYCSILDFYLS